MRLSFTQRFSCRFSSRSQTFSHFTFSLSFSSLALALSQDPRGYVYKMILNGEVWNSCRQVVIASRTAFRLVVKIVWERKFYLTKITFFSFGSCTLARQNSNIFYVEEFLALHTHRFFAHHHSPIGRRSVCMWIKFNQSKSEEEWQVD